MPERNQSGKGRRGWEEPEKELTDVDGMARCSRSSREGAEEVASDPPRRSSGMKELRWEGRWGVAQAQWGARPVVGARPERRWSVLDRETGRRRRRGERQGGSGEGQGGAGRGEARRGGGSRSSALGWGPRSREDRGEELRGHAAVERGGRRDEASEAVGAWGIDGEGRRARQREGIPSGGRIVTLGVRRVERGTDAGDELQPDQQKGDSTSSTAEASGEDLSQEEASSHSKTQPDPGRSPVQKVAGPDSSFLELPQHSYATWWRDRRRAATMDQLSEDSHGVYSLLWADFTADLDQRFKDHGELLLQEVVKLIKANTATLDRLLTARVDGAREKLHLELEHHQSDGSRELQARGETSAARLAGGGRNSAADPLGMDQDHRGKAHIPYVPPPVRARFAIATPPPSPQADASSATAAADAAAELPAGNAVETRPRASASDETTTLPLAALPPNPHVSSSSSTPPPSLPTTVTSVVDFKLVLEGTNFQHWRNYITLLLARYHVEDHVREVSVRRLDDPTWRDDDNTVEGDLLDIVAPAGSTAYTIWTRIHDYFHANEAEHAMHLGQEFRATVRGDLTINDYCRRLQGLAASLADVHEPVSDRTLTLQMLDGLGSKFAMQAAIIQSTVPLPNFQQARSRLVLAELSMDRRARSEGSQVLAVQSDDGGQDRSGARGSGCGGDRGDRSGDRAANGGGGRGGQFGASRAQRGNRGRGRGDAPPGRGAGATPWLGYFAPVGAPFPPPRAPWIPPNSVGVLGPHPGAPTHAYPLMFYVVCSDFVQLSAGTIPHVC
ncbi:hypothetical protein D1007_18779 [Hordeum vulgare]|nr:hypothetical protein D1007_18779 [Hordeum vulgare]